METKVCAKCREALPQSAFSRRRNGQTQPYCRSCNKEYQRAHYESNRDSYLERANERRPGIKREIQRKLLAYLADHPCVDCGETDPVVLEFDHLDRADKTVLVSRAVSNAWKWVRIETEIAKCAVRCANCHKRRTATQFGWYAGQVTA